jgi:hypothetical protein
MKEETVEEMVDARIDEKVSCEISSDGYVFITLSLQALEELCERARDSEKAVVVIHVPQLACN